MEQKNETPGNRLSKQLKGDLRLFAFYIGNETLLLPDISDLSVLWDEPSDALGNVFGMKLFSYYDKKGNRHLRQDIEEFIAIQDYILALQAGNTGPFKFIFTEEQLADPDDWRSVVVRFMHDVGNHRADTEPLKDMHFDLGWGLIDEGGAMERMTAIFTNVLQMDQDFRVINEEWCRHRASQYIRLLYDSNDEYEVDPPFEEWETMLWM